MKLAFIFLMVISFTSGALAEPGNEWKQSVEKRQGLELKQKIIGGVILGTLLYLFRDDLEEFSFRHNKVAYFALIFGVSEVFGWKIGLGFMLGREVTQLETWPELLGDSATDLLAGLVGIGISIKL